MLSMSVQKHAHARERNHIAELCAYVSCDRTEIFDLPSTTTLHVLPLLRPFFFCVTPAAFDFRPRCARLHVSFWVCVWAQKRLFSAFCVGTH